MIEFLKGDDPTLVAQALSKVVDHLVGDGDKSLMVDEITEVQLMGDGGPASIAALVTSAQTPPFLTERRVVIGRHLGIFSKQDEVAPLVRYLADPTDSTDLVLVWEKGTATQRLPAVPKPLKEALKAAGATETDAAPKGKGRKALLNQHLAEAAVRLDGGAKALITDRLGDDVGRAAAVLDALASTFGEGAGLTSGDVEPFLGEASDVPPWELTDAIDQGNISVALDKLHRMMGGGERHALQILATLHGHYQRALALDGAGIASEKDAAALLGMKGSTFPAKKALSLSRSLGSEKLREVFSLLATADLGVRGATAIDTDTLMEVLVARLAALSRRR
ncbi:MAG: DNA polymerase III subunit delta [Acidimicrobiales bacterium]